MFARIFHTDCEGNPLQLTPTGSSHVWQPFLPVILLEKPLRIAFVVQPRYFFSEVGGGGKKKKKTTEVRKCFLENSHAPYDLNLIKWN